MTGSEEPSIALRDNRRGAVFDDSREYRYRLWRTWDEWKPRVAFVMLNPSTADATEDDPTIRRCIGYAKKWDYGGLVVGNLFALRSTDPDALTDHPDPVGPDNDEYLREIARLAHRVVVAWGHRGGLNGRAEEVLELLREWQTVYRLGSTADGHPVHPLYQPADLEPEPFGDGVSADG